MATDNPASNSAAPVTSANLDNLRTVSAQLSSVAEDLAAVLPQIKEVISAVQQEASQQNQTTDGAPSPYYSPLLDSLATVGRKVHQNIEQLHQNVTGDATALKTIADAMGQSRDNSVQRVNEI